MKTSYEPEDDVLMIHLSDEPSVRTISQSWNINVSYTAAGDIAEIEILDASKMGLYPIQIVNVPENSAPGPGPDTKKLTERLVPHPGIIVGDTEVLERINWSQAWRP